MEIKKMSINEYAFAYHVRGYNLIPVGKDKRPLLSAWKQFQTNRQSDEQILEWFKDGKANVGIITGQISGLTVIDIDNKKGATITPEEMLAKFPPTLTVQSPSKGYHLYYKYAEGFTVSANAYPQFPNVDIRGDSGYVVAPPSTTSAGEYKVIKQLPIVDFPTHLFPAQKPKKTLTEQTTANKGNRNDSLASFAGKLLQASKEEEWETECLPAIQRANLSYNPPLPADEVLTVFNSIVKKERQRRSELIVSPIQLEDGSMSDPTAIKLHRNKSHTPYTNMANVVSVLSQHPYYKDALRYNRFRHEIEYNSKPLNDEDLYKIQHFLQTQTDLPNIGKEAVFAGVVHYAQTNSYDEAQDWLKALEWDGTARLADWLPRATHVDDDEYHRTIGANWWMGMIKRIMIPGVQWDYALLATGKQGTGKTSMFRIIGGQFYKSYSGGLETKDFYLAMRGALVFDLDEGATMYKAEVIKLKTIITETHDEYRAPYDKVTKKYPRRFVFSMSTNDPTPFQDVTGNRRYWIIDIPDQMIDFKFLEENRDQIFAEAYHYFKNKIAIDEVPMDIAKEKQDQHLIDDSWTDLICDEVRKSASYCKGDINYNLTVMEIYNKVFPNESNIRLDRKVEMRIAHILKKELGLEKIRKMIDGVQSNRWYITEKKMKELEKNNIKKTESIDDFDDIEQGKMEF